MTLRPLKTVHGLKLLSIALVGLTTAGAADATLLYSATLRNADYGAGFIVDTFNSCGDPDGSSCGDGNLANIGITNSPLGTLYTASNAVINYSMGRDYGSSVMNSFRSHGTVSVRFNASLQGFANGQPFTDNYGFNQFNNGQGTFGTGMTRHVGADGLSGTGDDRVQFTWTTWNANVWTTRAPVDSVLMDFERWINLGFAWDYASDRWDVWVDGVLVSSNNAHVPWGPSPGLGNPYNFALGMIHQRGITPPGSVHGIMFADLNIWDEYRPLGGTQAPPAAPEPGTLALLGLGLAGAAVRRWAAFTRASGKPSPSQRSAA